MENVVFENVQLRIAETGNNTVFRSLEPIPGFNEPYMRLGNAKVGFLEIRSNAKYSFDQLTMIKRDGKRVNLFKNDVEIGESQSRNFHNAFKNNSDLNSSKHSEIIYFNVIDSDTKKKIRICVNPQGYYHTNEKGGIDRSRKICYQDMDGICESTKARAKEIGIDLYTRPEVGEQAGNPPLNLPNLHPSNKVDNAVDFTNIATATPWKPPLRKEEVSSQKQKYVIPEKKPIRICAIL